MYFVLAPKEIQPRGEPPQAADLRQQLEEDSRPQCWEPHLYEYVGSLSSRLSAPGSGEHPRSGEQGVTDTLSKF